MNVFFKYLFLALFILVLIPQGMSQNDKDLLSSIPVILDKEKSYPETEFEHEVEVTFIPLETNKDILLDRGAHIYYVSDSCLMITNMFKGDVFIFDMTGKAISHFNQKGGLGYVRIDYAVYDSKNQEIFILDEISRKIAVFNEKGEFRQRFNLPSDMYSGEIYNFNDSTLLVYNEYLYGEFTQRQPYFFVSKKDGTIISRLNINLDKANPKILVTDVNGGKNAYSISTNFEGSCTFGDEIIIANMSLDTIYILNKDRKLIPYFVQYPTVFSDPPVITGVVMKTKDFIVFSVYPYDLKKSKKRIDVGARSREEVKFILYDFNNGNFFTCKRWKYIANKVDLPKNTTVKLINSYHLINQLEQGKLTGQLKEIATGLKVDDNPVVKITRFK
jgi:hypothetical protein